MLKRARGRLPRSTLTTPVAGGEVLLYIRNPATVDRIIDLWAALADADIAIRVTLHEGRKGSPFLGDGVRERLRELGITTIPWRKAVRMRFAVVIASHATKGLLRLRWPNVIVMPHGAGYNRVVPENTGSMTAPVGLSRRELTRRCCRLKPRVICLSAEEQLLQLASSGRGLLARAAVIGDPAYTLLQKSLVRRQSYREQLGVGPEQKLVVVTSTWGDWSLQTQCPTIASRLLAQLPADQYKVVQVLHPNIAARRSEFGLDCWLNKAKAAGLVVLPPFKGGWRAALIAADIVVGDHGSVTFYGGAIDRPVLALRTGLVELVAESPFRDFLTRTVELRPDGDLRAQVERTIADYRSGQFDTAVRRVIDTEVDALEQLRMIIFTLLGRRKPKRPIHFRAVPDPEHIPPGRVTSYQVRVTTRRRRDRLDEVVLERVPSAVADRPWQDSVEDVITMFEHDEVNARDPERTEIVFDFAETDADDAIAWTRKIHEQLPGLAIATATHEEHVLMRLADGRAFAAVPVQRGKRVSIHQFAYMASALLRALVLEGEEPAGSAEVDVKVTMAPCWATIRIRPVEC